jgi:hypothetical protein
MMDRVSLDRSSSKLVLALVKSPPHSGLHRLHRDKTSLARPAVSRCQLSPILAAVAYYQHKREKRETHAAALAGIAERFFSSCYGAAFIPFWTMNPWLCCHLLWEATNTALPLFNSTQSILRTNNAVAIQAKNPVS